MPAIKKKVTSTTKKITRKKTTRKSPRKNISPKVEEEIIPEKQFINIYERDPILEAKSKLSWIIVGFLTILVILFWFWSINKNMGIGEDEKEDSGIAQITDEIKQSMDEFRGIISDAQNMLEHTNADLKRKKDIEDIKNGVLEQIRVNLESENWPEHSSELIGVALKYPGNWYKQEDKESINLFSYDPISTSTNEVFVEIIIRRIENKGGESLEDLGIDFEQYIETDKEIFIDLIPATRYDSNAVEENITSYIVLLSKNAVVYEIKVYSENGQNVFEPVIEKILSTIDLL